MYVFRSALANIIEKAAAGASKARRQCKRAILQVRLDFLYRKYRNYTMVHGPTYVKNLLIAHGVRNVDGCVIECGVWRGGMVAGIAEVMGPEREYFLFDSFEGLPAATNIDGPAALAWQSATTAPGYHENCTASIEEAQAAMKMSGAANCSLVKGWFDQTLPNFRPPRPIALLRLDGDWYDSIRICLEHLSPYLAPNGIVIVDDYYVWDGCAKAVHEFLAQKAGSRRIRQMYNSVCVLSPS